MTATRQVVRRPTLGRVVVKKHIDGELFDVGRREVTLGLDPSYTGFGVVALDPRDEHYAAWLGVSPYKGVQRLVAIGAWLEQLLGQLDAQHEVVQVALEGYAHGSKFGREQAGELGAVIKTTLVRHYGVNSRCAYPTIVPPSTLKKYVTGKGTVEKNQMLLKVFQSWGVEFNDDNLADAYALARLAAGWEQGEDLAYRRAVLKSLVRYTEWPLAQTDQRAG